MKRILKKPITIAKWQRNKREQIRVVLKQLSGRNVIELRTWWINEEGKECPGKDGITLDVRHTPTLAGVYKEACRIVRKHRLLDTK
jgi:hypothetical protein